MSLPFKWGRETTLLNFASPLKVRSFHSNRTHPSLQLLLDCLAFSLSLSFLFGFFFFHPFSLSHAPVSRQHVFLKDFSLDLAVDVFIKGPWYKCKERNKMQNDATGRSRKAGQLQSHPLTAACWWELMWQPICRKGGRRGVLELNLSSHGAAIYSNLFAWPWSLHSTVRMEWQSSEGMKEWARRIRCHTASDEKEFLTLYLRDINEYKYLIRKETDTNRRCIWMTLEVSRTGIQWQRTSWRFLLSCWHKWATGQTQDKQRPRSLTCTCGTVRCIHSIHPFIHPY